MMFPAAISCTPFFFHSISPSTTKVLNLNHTAYFACKAKPSTDDDDDDSPPKHSPNNIQVPKTKFDRRRFLLMGIGSSGIYTALANLKSLSPDFPNCVDAVKPDGEPINCCPTPGHPPKASDITEFVPPAAASIRVRTAAQSDDGAITLEKYRKAVELMKKLPPDDPRSFKRQADVHCAYCDGAYSQDGFSDRKFKIHRSWLFFPFHRLYLYFFEKICAKLLNDQTFALPFWNWDSPSGMQIPSIFNVPDSPLFDSLRNQGHLPPAVADLNYDGNDRTDLTTEELINYNLSVMYKQMITNGTTPRLFMGQPFKAGDDINSIDGPGSIEIAPHNTLHTWTGDPREPNTENMGVFYSAARDPIFYAHHANIDRLWTIWVYKLHGNVFTDTDWLETSFVFYDEDKKPVRVKIKDCLDITKLGYTYQEVETPWINAKPRPRHPKGVIRTLSNAHVLPKKLDEVINVVVKRPRRLRTQRDEEEAEEVLLMEDIEYDGGEQVKFDIYVNEYDADSCTPENTEFLGSFASVPHGRHDEQTVERGSIRFALSSVMLELGADEDETLLVTVVPRRGRVRIGGVKIEYDASKSRP